MEWKAIKKRNFTERQNFCLIETSRENLLKDAESVRTGKKERYRMEIQKAAMAGTLESSDAQVTVMPGDGKGIELTLEIGRASCRERV